MSGTTCINLLNKRGETMNIQTNNFTTSLREWRKLRKMSQLELALAAEVSQRHVSWLETGRSQPSREMVLRLSEAMDVPLRERNHILNAAGYANMYTEKDLNEPSMEPVKNILLDMLAHHEPYPAYVLDRYWNIKMQNQAANVMFDVAGDPEAVWQAIGDNGERNIALLTVHPNGLRQFITNWDDIASQFMRRLKKEALDSADSEVMARYEQLSEHVMIPEEQLATPLLPMLPIDIDLGGLKLSLCSVISTFGTAQDITADELRVETFYPANEQTAKFFRE